MLKRINKRKKLNSLILEQKLRDLTVENSNNNDKNVKVENEPKIIELVEKIKKKGIPKDELISTKRLLTR